MKPKYDQDHLLPANHVHWNDLSEFERSLMDPKSYYDKAVKAEELRRLRAQVAECRC